jgi:hypothetical protein
VVIGATVYLRSGAGMSFAPVTVLHGGQVLTILQAGEWLRVSTLAHEGFIHSAFCREE